MQILLSVLSTYFLLGHKQWKINPIIEQNMTTRKIHYISGLTITLFIILHLFNHICSIFGVDKHIKIMNVLRHFYRNIFVETTLLSAIIVQIISGLKLYRKTRNSVTTNFENLHLWTGIYFVAFFIIHVSVVLGGHFFYNLTLIFILEWQG